MAEKKSAKETNGKDSAKETKTRTAKTKADSRAKTAEGEKGADCEDDGETGGKAEAAHKEPRKGKAQDEPEGDRAGRSG